MPRQGTCCQIYCCYLHLSHLLFVLLFHFLPSFILLISSSNKPIAVSSYCFSPNFPKKTSFFFFWIIENELGANVRYLHVVWSNCNDLNIIILNEVDWTLGGLHIWPAVGKLFDFNVRLVLQFWLPNSSSKSHSLCPRLQDVFVVKIQFVIWCPILLIRTVKCKAFKVYKRVTNHSSFSFHSV